MSNARRTLEERWAETEKELARTANPVKMVQLFTTFVVGMLAEHDAELGRLRAELDALRLRVEGP